MVAGDLNPASLIPGMGSVPQGHTAGQVCWVGFRTSLTQHKKVIGVEGRKRGLRDRRAEETREEGSNRGGLCVCVNIIDSTQHHYIPWKQHMIHTILRSTSFFHLFILFIFSNAYYLCAPVARLSAGPAYLIPSSHPMRLELWDPHFIAEVTAQSN